MTFTVSLDIIDDKRPHGVRFAFPAGNELGKAQSVSLLPGHRGMISVQLFRFLDVGGVVKAHIHQPDIGNMQFDLWRELIVHDIKSL